MYFGIIDSLIRPISYPKRNHSPIVVDGVYVSIFPDLAVTLAEEIAGNSPQVIR